MADNWVMSAADISTFRHEIAALQKLRSIFSQKPLDRRGAGLVGPDMDIANALFHSLSPRPLSRAKAGEIRFAERSRQSKRDVVRSAPMTGTSIDQIADFAYAEKHKCQSIS